VLVDLDHKILHNRNGIIVLLLDVEQTPEDLLAKAYHRDRVLDIRQPVKCHPWISEIEVVGVPLVGYKNLHFLLAVLQGPVLLKSWLNVADLFCACSEIDFFKFFNCVDPISWLDVHVILVQVFFGDFAVVEAGVDEGVPFSVVVAVEISG
jgi:hypothetical protein